MRILIIRTSALGDIVQSLPVLTALRRHHPQARIGWVVEEAFAPLLTRHPDLDETLVVNLRGWRRRPWSRQTIRDVASLVQHLQDFAPDVVLDLMGNHKAGILAALSLCDRRIGLRREFRREPSSALWISEGVAPAGEHAVDRALSVALPLGLPRELADFAPEKLLQALGSRQIELAKELDDPFAVICPGAGWENKRYPEASWGEVARELGGIVNVVVATGPGEETLGRAVVAASGGRAQHLHAPTLPHLGALAHRAQLFLAGDTGPLHLAHALGTPVVCLMGPTDPLKHGPYGAPHRALWHQLPCSFCHKRFAETQACLRELSPRRVVAEATRLLQAGPLRPAALPQHP